MASAEVPEVRSLLSAGVAAVHQAAAHAESLAPHATLHPTVTPQLTTGGHQFTGPPATSFSISQPNLTPGSVVKIHAVFTVNIANISVSFKGSFSGKVKSSAPVLSFTLIDVTPTGGSFVDHYVEAGTKRTQTLVPDGKVATVQLDAQGHFVGCNLEYVPKTNPGGQPAYIAFAT
jgi:hypothetical protein